METKILKLVFFLGLVVAASFFYYSWHSQFSLADDYVCPPPPPDPSTSWTNTWTEYSCENNNCAGKRLWRQATQYCYTTCAPIYDEHGCMISWTCSAKCNPPQYGAPQVLDTCQQWSSCTGTGWSPSVPTCDCDGKCLEVPKNPTPADGVQDLELPTNLVDSEHVNKVNWDDVLGWLAANGPRSYRIRVVNTNYQAVEGQSIAELPPCTFQSHTTNHWQVQACCTSDGQNCGTPSDWEFETTLPPELVSPEDPDWDGPEYAEPNWNPAEKFQVHFDWCSVPGAQSYYMRAYKAVIEGGEKHLYCPAIACPAVIEDGMSVPASVSEAFVDFNLDAFTKQTHYDWEIAACLQDDGRQCGETCPANSQWDHSCTEYSQRWSLFGSIGLKKVELLAPPDGAVVNKLDVLSWEHVDGAKSYIYEISGKRDMVRSDYISLKDIWEKYGIKLVTNYSWRVKACWDDKGLECQEDTWSDLWRFRTTGDPPTFNASDSGPPDGAQDILIPATLNWDDMPGAASYNFKLTSTFTGFRPIVREDLMSRYESEIELNYPDLLSSHLEPYQLARYVWEIQTCADLDGQICGNWSGRSFSTVFLVAPTDPVPVSDGKNYPPGSVAWAKVRGAHFYQYKMIYAATAPEEVSGRCQGLVGQTVVDNKIVPFRGDIAEINCLGTYNWQVKACLDLECKDYGPWSVVWSFTLLSSAPERITGLGGLVPCGRRNDDPETPYDEREACEIKHIFILIQSGLNFALWRLLFPVVVIMLMTTGVMTYFAFGGPTILAQARSLLKLVAVGVAVAFFAWTMITWVLNFWGVTTPWWNIPF